MQYDGSTKPVIIVNPMNPTPRKPLAVGRRDEALASSRLHRREDLSGDTCLRWRQAAEHLIHVPTDAATPMTDSDEDPSVLGTLQHWDEVYCSELRNLQETGDEGEIWCDHLVWVMALYSH